jgi:class 3 adenylate cyclase
MTELVKAGLHTGECDVVADRVSGTAVEIGREVGANAATGEVLVSNTVKDLVVGSGIRFEGRGVHRLKEASGEWRFFAVETEPSPS